MPSSGLQKGRPHPNTNEALCTAPILDYPQPKERFVVDTEERNVRIGGMLSQVQEDRRD
jgi:hypothetical protein